jgi:hypothetical protein
VSLSAANGAQAPVALVVEDEFFVRLDISTCLREAGYFVIESGPTLGDPAGVYLWPDPAL